MPARRFRQLSIRNKLLLMALLPLVVAAPLLGLLLLGWSSTVFDKLLITKVRSDLATAQGYFERVLGEVGAATEAAASSHTLHLALGRSGQPMQALMAGHQRRAHLDFLNLLDAQGRLIAADWRSDALPRPADAPDLRLPEGAQLGERHSTVELLSHAQLRRLAPALADAPPIALVPTPNAAPAARSLEDRALLVLASSPVLAADGRLLGYVQGGVLLNRNLGFIDHINEIVYPEDALIFGSQGTATLFLEDVRITTNVRLFGSQRAIGTRVSQTVRDAVLGRGSTWLDRAFVVNDWYVSAYQPLLNGAGQRVGMLYVGYQEQPFTLMKYAALASIGALFLGAMLIAAALSMRLARAIFGPLEHMARTMRAVEDGNGRARFDPARASTSASAPAANDEIGQLGGHLDHLLDVVDDKTRALQRWGEELDRKVAERTQDLARSNASLQQAQQQLVRSEKLAAIGQLTAGIAHEINNPIAVIQGNLDLMRELLPSEARRAVGTELGYIDTQIERMRLIVTQLLQYARPTEYAGYVEAVDGAEAIEASLVLAGHSLASGRHTLRRDFRASARAGINRQELQQVLINLIVNAIQAMDSPGVLSLSTRDWLDAARRPMGVVIEVADSGPGLDAPLLAELFQPFVTRKKDGTGLGLWISQSLVERYGGEIRAANDAATGGAVFSVWLRSEPVATAAR